MPPRSTGASLFAAEPDRQWRLPYRMREISGLAATPDGRIMGHDDEVAVLYEIDVDTGAVVKRFSAGSPPFRGDFEGLAIGPDGTFYIATSTSILLRFREGEHRASVPYERFDLGLRRIGEVEGLAYLVGEDEVIVACKRTYQPALNGKMMLWSWSPKTPKRPARPWLSVPSAPLAEAVGATTFHPSSVEIDPATGRLIILAARERGMVELDSSGAIVAARKLGRRHRQAEGSAILPNGDLAIADEGGDARALISRYARLK